MATYPQIYECMYVDIDNAKKVHVQSKEMTYLSDYLCRGYFFELILYKIDPGIVWFVDDCCSFSKGPTKGLGFVKYTKTVQILGSCGCYLRIYGTAYMLGHQTAHPNERNVVHLHRLRINLRFLS